MSTLVPLPFCWDESEPVNSHHDPEASTKAQVFTAVGSLIQHHFVDCFSFIVSLFISHRFFFPPFIRLVYFLGKRSDRKKEGVREKMLPFTDSISKHPQHPGRAGWDKTKSGAKNCIHVSHVGGQDLRT